MLINITTHSPFPRYFYYALTVAIALNLTSCSTTPEREITTLPAIEQVAPPISVELSTPIIKPMLPETNVPISPTTPLSINQNVKNFVRQMVTKHHFNELELTQLLQSAVIKEGILKSISSPSEGLPP